MVGGGLLHCGFSCAVQNLLSLTEKCDWHASLEFLVNQDRVSPFVSISLPFWNEHQCKSTFSMAAGLMFARLHMN